jgi:hypothetical protein
MILICDDVCSNVFYDGILLNGVAVRDRPPIVPGLPATFSVQCIGEVESECFFSFGRLLLLLTLLRKADTGTATRMPTRLA